MRRAPSPKAARAGWSFSPPRHRGSWLALPLLVAVAIGAAPSARAAEQVTVARYDMAHEVGVGVGNGGLFAGLRPWPTLRIPSWATSASIEVVDDRGAPVAGRADVYGSDAPSWAGRRLRTSHAICSGTARTIPVPRAGTLDVRLIAGVSAEPNHLQPIGPGDSHRSTCPAALSSPTTGAITVTFRA